MKYFNKYIFESIEWMEKSNDVGKIQEVLSDLGIFIGNFGPKGDGVDNIAGKFTFSGIKVLLDLLKDEEVRKKLELEIKDEDVLNYKDKKLTNEQEKFILSLKGNKELKDIIKKRKKELEKEYKSTISKKLPKNVSKFLDKYSEEAVEASREFYRETGKFLYPSVMLAQAALESGWGESGLTKRHNNFFGIKATPSWDGDVVKKRTREVIDGKTVYKKEPFRSYDSPEDSFYDRNNFLLKNKRYKKAGVFDADNPIEQIKALKKAGYATDPNYVKAISNIIYSYGLDKFDDMILMA